MVKPCLWPRRVPGCGHKVPAGGHDGPRWWPQKSPLVRRSNFNRRVWHPARVAAGLPQLRFLEPTTPCLQTPTKGSKAVRPRPKALVTALHGRARTPTNDPARAMDARSQSPDRRSPRGHHSAWGGAVTACARDRMLSGCQGSRVRESTWRGRTTVKSRRLMVARRLMASRSAKATREASVPPRRMSAYARTNSAIRSQSTA